MMKLEESLKALESFLELTEDRFMYTRMAVEEGEVAGAWYIRRGAPPAGGVQMVHVCDLHALIEHIGNDETPNASGYARISIDEGKGLESLVSRMRCNRIAPVNISKKLISLMKISSINHI